jgi:hypothetical protein
MIAASSILPIHNFIIMGDCHSIHRNICEEHQRLPVADREALMREIILLPNAIAKDNCSTRPDLNASHTVEANEGDVYESSISCSIDIPENHPNQHRIEEVKQPSELCESLLKKWNEPSYDTSKLFVDVNYSEIFKKNMSL